MKDLFFDIDPTDASMDTQNQTLYHSMDTVLLSPSAEYERFTDNIFLCFSKPHRSGKQSNESTADQKASVLFARPFISEAFHIFSERKC